MACVENAGMSPLIPHSYWDNKPPVDGFDYLVPNEVFIAESISVFNVLAMAQDDDALSSAALGISADTVLTNSLFNIYVDKAQKQIVK